MQTDLFIDTHGKRKNLNLRFHREATKRYHVKDLDSLVADDFQILKSMITHHQNRQVPRLKELYDYAKANNHTVLDGKRRKESDMADNRAVHNFGAIVSTFKQGFLTGVPIKVEYEEPTGSADEQSPNDIALDKMAVENDFNDLNRDLIQDLSKVGRAYDIVYRNTKDQTRVRQLDPLETFVIYDMSLSQHSVAAVRYYNGNPHGEEQLLVVLYTDDHVITYDASDGSYIEIDREPHSFGDVQITEYLNNKDGMGDYEAVLSLIDLYDAGQSDTANYMTDLSDAILAIFGVIEQPEGMTKNEQLEYAKSMRQARMMFFKPPTDSDGKAAGDVDAKYLYKQYDVAGTEAYKDRIENAIHKFTNTPDLTDDNFAGNQSGEAMKYKMFGLEQEGDNTKSRFSKSLKRRYELIATVGELASELMDFDINKLKITFTPNLPKSLSDMIKNFVDLNGEVSNETAMRITNIVDDVPTEIEKLEKEDGKETEFQRRLRERERLTDSDLAGE